MRAPQRSNRSEPAREEISRGAMPSAAGNRPRLICLI